MQRNTAEVKVNSTSSGSEWTATAAAIAPATTSAADEVEQEPEAALPWWKTEGKVKGKRKRTMEYDQEHGQLFIDERDDRGNISHTWYYLERIKSDHGKAFRFFKVTGTKPDQDYPTYDVNLDTEDLDRGNHTCECLGHLRWGYKTRCKHVASAVALTRLGKV